MAATEKLLRRGTAVITADTIVLPFETGPISKIMESVPTESVEIDIRNSLINEVRPTDEIELGVIASDSKTIEEVLGRLIGGEGFLYQIGKPRERRGSGRYYSLYIKSLISPLQPMMLAKALQKLDGRVTFYVGDDIVPAF